MHGYSTLALTFLHIWCFGILLSFGAPEEVKIGFIRSDDEPDIVEKVFQLAVSHVNSNPKMLKNVDFDVVARQFEKDDNSLAKYKTVCDLLDDGVVALFGPQESEDNSLVASSAAAHHIPHVQMSWHHDLDFRPLSVCVDASPAEIVEAMKEVAQHLGWLFIAYVYKSDSALVRLQALKSHPDMKKVQVIAFDLEAIDKPWEDVRKTGIRNIVLDVDTEETNSVIEQMISAQLMTEFYTFIVPDLDFDLVDLGEHFRIESDIYWFRLLDLDNKEYQIFLKDLELHHPNLTENNEHKETEVALVYDAVQVFAQAVEQFTTTGGTLKPSEVSCTKPESFFDLGKPLYNILKQIQLEESLSGNIDFDDHGIRKADELEVWIVEKGEHKKEIGKWTLKDGLDMYGEEENKDHVSSIENKTLIVTTVISPPFVMLTPGSLLRGNERYEGYSIELLRRLAKLLNFDFYIQEVVDGNYGSPNKAGNWNGMLGELIEGKADLAIAPLTITAQRLKAVDFTAPFMETGIGLMYKNEDESVSYSFFSPFSVGMWFMLLFTILAGMAILCFIARLTPLEWFTVNETKIENTFSLGNTFWLLYSAIMFQRVTIKPRSASIVIAIVSWWIFCLVVMISYGTVLGEFLVRYRERPTLSSIDDLIQQNKIKYAAISGGSTEEFFKHSSYPQYQMIGRGLEKQGVENTSRAIELAQSGSHAIFLEMATLEYIVNRQCELEQIGDVIGSKSYGIALAKGSPFQSELSQGILKLKGSGILQQMHQYWWKEYGAVNCPEESSIYRPTPFTVRFGRLNLLFIFLLLGIIFALGITLYTFIKEHQQAYKDSERKVPFEILLRELRNALGIDGGKRKTTIDIEDGPQAEMKENEVPSQNNEPPKEMAQSDGGNDADVVAKKYEKAKNDPSLEVTGV